MKTIICQPKDAIARFVSWANKGEHWQWENYSALGLLDESGGLIAGVLYNHYQPPNICMHVGAVPGRKWLNRNFLFSAFDYPFNQLQVNRVTALVPKKNKDARRFDEHLGFRLEGVLRKALPDDDMLVMGMLRKECRWLDMRPRLSGSDFNDSCAVQPKLSGNGRAASGVGSNA